MVTLYYASYLAVLVAAVASFLLGWLWYSRALFGNAWVKASGFTKADMEKAKKKGMTTSMIFGLIAQFVMAWVLGGFIVTMGLSGVAGGVCAAFMAWLGFVATIGLGTVLWEGKPMRLFWINSLHWLVALLIQGAIIGAWTA